MRNKKWQYTLLSMLLAYTITGSSTFAAVPKQVEVKQEAVVIQQAAEATVQHKTEETLQLEARIDAIKQYLIQKVPEAQVGSIGGEWLIIGLARYQNEGLDNYFESYYTKVKNYVKEAKGILSTRKYTEYSRLVLALTAIGKDPKNVAGYNLLTPLGDYEAVIKQGINGPIFALIALDSGNYEMPVCQTAKVKATREAYIQYILKAQLEDGGFNLSGMVANPDVTAMALTALAPYKEQAEIKTAIERGVDCLSKMQTASGGYTSYGEENVESAAQVLTAINALGISPSDERFVKNGHGLVQNIFSFYKEGEGFYHILSTAPNNQMATEQAFYSLVSTWRVLQGQSSLYAMQNEKQQ